ncbi:AAA-domain-containing protein [Backusella circina FSU 941]|nr:AAA-domain-containing protein [Backusella circina FSU 941]
MAAFNHSDHLVIKTPAQGASYLHDHIAQQLALDVEADLITFDAQDFIFIAQHNFDRDAVTVLPMLAALDLDANALLALRPNFDGSDENPNDVGNLIDQINLLKKGNRDDMEDDDLEKVKMKSNLSNRPVELDLEDIYDELGSSAGAIDTTTAVSASKGIIQQVTGRYSQMFKRLISSPTTESKNVIVYLRDYSGMHDAFTRIMLKSLVGAIEELKQKGAPILLLAASSPLLEKHHQSNYIPLLPNMRTITIPPSLDPSWISTMAQDSARRITEINTKQMMASYYQKNVLGLCIDEALQQSMAKLPGISKQVWSPRQVDRRVITAIGHALERKKNKFELSDFEYAAKIIKDVSHYRKSSKPSGTPNLEDIKKSCNEYERKLIPRIVDPLKVQGSFKDIQAPPLTKETLHALITLPLIRPDLFQNGILKKNFIPGVLLFGPPGTGKTMLAKAVARESGSRMLDIQASDVYDMYVGQGEKNVKAIFSLARKLSPCVIFVDEVDSLMNKRGSDSSTKSHREIINQFMVEWDGLMSDNQGVIVMAATNRPFDLDDAVLRRMPRRILVDLPNQQDRAEILKILLQDEKHQIELSDLALATEHYSGSDLKNLCVTAALKAVQQQVETNKPQPLTMDHFTQALKMIPASSSEDMDSLVEIRKWASQYGDGGKKKKSLLGFS